jgi:hypothetical protein
LAVGCFASVAVAAYIAGVGALSPKPEPSDVPRGYVGAFGDIERACQPSSRCKAAGFTAWPAPINLRGSTSSIRRDQCTWAGLTSSARSAWDVRLCTVGTGDGIIDSWPSRARKTVRGSKSGRSDSLTRNALSPAKRRSWRRLIHRDAQRLDMQATELHVQRRLGVREPARLNFLIRPVPGERIPVAYRSRAASSGAPHSCLAGSSGAAGRRRGRSGGDADDAGGVHVAISQHDIRAGHPRSRAC